LAMINAHPGVRVKAVCDSTRFILDVLGKYSGVNVYTDFNAMLREVELDAVLIATPAGSHGKLAGVALERGLHVFCEKPLCLDTREGEAVTALAQEKGAVNQVGYHNRFVGAFREVKRLLDSGAVGEVTHVLAEAYGPVVLRQQGSTWRSQRKEGGGCLYDYAAHPVNLVNWYLGSPAGVGGTVMNSVFSKETDDEVFSTLYFPNGRSAQISVNWSDDSFRKMSTRITIWGKNGRIYADRQECRAYLRDAVDGLGGYRQGWNVRFTTELTEPVWFYVRGEEYSAQLDYFVRCIEEKRTENVNSFENALVTDRVLAMMIADSGRGASVQADDAPMAETRQRKWFQFM